MKTLYTVCCLLFLTASVMAQKFTPNYDESRVPAYTLPDPLVWENGQRLSDPADWPARRAEILELFATQVYGRVPQAPYQMKAKVRSVNPVALNKTAIRKEVELEFRANGRKLKAQLLIYLPAGQVDRVPVFLAYNFYGNHSIHPDPKISLTKSWVRNNEALGISANRATAASRGARASRWPVEEILARGYGLAVMYYGDIDPDYDDFQNGIHPLFYAPGQQRPAPDEWGAIAAWAWGLSRAMDYLLTDREVDARRVAVMGHSRLGKTALWAGAVDQRFAMVISNNSGCGGAALSRRRFGETVGRINRSFPHWFCDNFEQYNENEDALPVDQHELLALIAPRPVYVASASEDRWADPRGEFLAAKHAAEVYEWLGYPGLPAEGMPAPGQQLMGTVGYHLRPGKHDLTSFDWHKFMDFADKHWKGK